MSSAAWLFTSSVVVALAACRGAGDSASNSVMAVVAGTTAASTASSFKVQVWADNWFSLYVDETFVGEDPVPITTERSFNAETLSFSAATRS